MITDKTEILEALRSIALVQDQSHKDYFKYKGEIEHEVGCVPSSRVWLRCSCMENLYYGGPMEPNPEQKLTPMCKDIVKLFARKKKNTACVSCKFNTSGFLSSETDGIYLCSMCSAGRPQSGVAGHVIHTPEFENMSPAEREAFMNKINKTEENNND